MTRFLKRSLAEDRSGQFESVDAEIYYALIRCRKPKRIVEIGAGFSTALAASAVSRNKCGQITAIEPYPRPFLKSLGVRVIEKKLQDVPISGFASLESGDILFIDSSHIVAIGSDVNYEILELLPRLKPGVLIQIHDIFWPSAHYPKYRVLGKKEFWNEQYLVQAFLAFNSAFRILLAGSYLHLTAPEVLQKYFPSYSPERRWPGTLWLERVS